LKIVHLAKYYYPYSGGIETVVRSLCLGASSEHDVSVYCSHTKPIKENDIIDKVTIYRLPRYGVLASQPINPHIFFMMSGLKNADIIHVHSPNPLFELAVLILAPKNARIVVTHHSDIVKQKFLGKLYKPLLKMFYKRVDKIIVATKNHISSSPVLTSFQEKTKVIPFGLDLNDYPNDEEVEQKATDLEKKYGKYFLFIGRLVEYKGVSFLIEALKNVNANLLICGCGPLEYELKEQAKALNLSDKVHFLGRVEGQKNMGALIKASLGLVLPSISNNENFGMVQLEAMIYSKPVIATSLPSGASTIVKHGRTGYLAEPKSSTQLCKYLTKILTLPDHGRELGENGFERFNEVYTYQKMIQGHLNLYKKVLEK